MEPAVRSIIGPSHRNHVVLGKPRLAILTGSRHFKGSATVARTEKRKKRKIRKGKTQRPSDFRVRVEGGANPCPGQICPIRKLHAKLRPSP